MSTPTKAPRRRTSNPRTPAAKGRRVRVQAHPYAVMVYRLSMAVLATIVVLNLAGRN